VSLGERTIRGAGDLLASLPRSAIGSERALRLLRHNEILRLVVTPIAAPLPA